MLREADLELVQRDLDNDLTGEEKERLQALLSANPDLQLMQDRLRRVADKLAELPPVTPPYSLVDAILPQLEKAPVRPAVAAVEAVREELPALEWKQPEKKPARRKQLPVWLARAGTGIAAACLLLGIFVMAKGVIDRTGTGSRPGPDNGQPAVVQNAPEPPPSVPAQGQPDNPDKPQQPDNKQPSKGQPAQPKPPANKKQPPAVKPQKLNNPPAVATTPENGKGKAATPARAAITDELPHREKEDDKDKKKENKKTDPGKKQAAGGDKKDGDANKGKSNGNKDDDKGRGRGNGDDDEKENDDGNGQGRGKHHDGEPEATLEMNLDLHLPIPGR
jgi:hypothetical protein